MAPATPRKARPGRDGPWSAGARVAPPFRLPPVLRGPLDRVLAERLAGRVEALVEPPARALVVEDAVLATFAPYPTVTTVTGPHAGGGPARGLEEVGGAPAGPGSTVGCVHEDEGTPPPIPAYRPEQAGQEPADDPAGTDAQADHDRRATVRERERALESLEAKAGFRSHLSVYLLVMALLVGIWGVTTFGGFFWPIFPMMGWGLGVAIHGMSLRWDREPSEEEIAAEMARLRHRPGQQRGLDR